MFVLTIKNKDNLNMEFNDKITLTIVRDDTTFEANLTLAEQP